MCLELQKWTYGLPVPIHTDTLKRAYKYPHVRVRTHTHTHAHTYTHMLTEMQTHAVDRLGRTSSCLSRTQLSFPRLGKRLRLGSGGKGRKGKRQAGWREANLLLQATDGVRTNYTAGIKTPF